MPSLNASRNVDMGNYLRKAVTAPSQPPMIQPGPVHLTPSPVMISSIPSIATDVDGITRQFYGRGNLPIRRLILPT